MSHGLWGLKNGIFATKGDGKGGRNFISELSKFYFHNYFCYYLTVRYLLLYKYGIYINIYYIYYYTLYILYNIFITYKYIYIHKCLYMYIYILSPALIISEWLCIYMWIYVRKIPWLEKFQIGLELVFFEKTIRKPRHSQTWLWVLLAGSYTCLLPL